MELTVRVDERIASIPRTEWDRLSHRFDTPILDWSWLDLLERSGSIVERHGWAPRHLTLWHGTDLVAAAPLYLKTHSWGEFVYDFMFAQASSRSRLPWYPKLVGMSPATPSVGWRVLVAEGYDEIEITNRWIEEAEGLAARDRAVSLQLNFTDPSWSDRLGERTPTGGRWYRWSHQNFLWENRHFETFDDYLAEFDKNQRRNIKKERKSLVDQQMSVRMVRGDEIPSEWFSLMGALYDKTNDQFGPYAARFLEPAFFELLDRIRPILTFAATFDKGEATPMALSFLIGRGTSLIGRYWGERAHRDHQYFNVCYYEPIDWAIRNSIRTFDPGAGSALKTRRGFLSKRNVSVHRFFDDHAGSLFSTFIDDIDAQEREQIDELNLVVPFKKPLKKTILPPPSS